MMLRKVLIVVLFGLFSGAGPLAAEVPALIDASLTRLRADEGHWAYTLTTQEDGAKAGDVTRERYDPSQPPDKAWGLILYHGRAPTASEREHWQKQKLEQERNREGHRIGDLMLFDQATVIEETPEIVTYEVPLEPDAVRGLSPDIFLVRLEVQREEPAFRRLWLVSKRKFRVRGIARVDSMEVDVHFGVIDPHYAPRPVRLHAAAKARVMFLFKAGGGVQATWTDYQRVPSYDDRFGVKLGELKVLDF